MYKLKTTPLDSSVASYLQAIEDESRRQDCTGLVALMERVTGCPAKMWGAGIVGFDSYHYRYDSGHAGDFCVVGLSSRKAYISLYLQSGYDAPETQALLKKLGKYAIGKSCMNIKRLSDIDLTVLEPLIELSVADTKRRYPG